MAYIEGEQRGQHSLFPTTLDELISEDHICRVIEAFVGRLDMAKLSFVRSEPAETGRPGYDPRDLLKLYLYGYLWQIRSSRRLETECQRNVEVMWLLGRLVPDYKSIAEFRRMHREAVAEAGAELVRFARPSAQSTTMVMASYSTALRSSMTRPQIPSAARRARPFGVSSSLKRIAP